MQVHTPEIPHCVGINACRAVAGPVVASEYRVLGDQSHTLLGLQALYSLAGRSAGNAKHGSSWSTVILVVVDY